MYIEITYDTFNIANRIKNIDKDYFIRFNKKSKKYEVWLKTGVNAHLELVIPYRALDFRTIKKVLQSKVTKINEIIREIDEENEKLEIRQNNAIKDELCLKVKTLLKY